MTVLLSLPLTATSYTGPACAAKEATAAARAEAGSNMHTQPSQLQLYLRHRRHAEPALAASAARSQARFGNEVVNHAGHLLLVLQVGEDGPGRGSCRAYVPNANATVASTADYLRHAFREVPGAEAER